jgi:serine/threonine protein kinase
VGILLHLYRIGFLHDRQIVYRDLKMENLALDMEMHIKLVDFGFAKYLNGNRTNTICGTLQYMAPEIAWGGFYGFAVDWFSYGTILYILFTGKYPFPNGHAELHTQLVFHCYKAPDEASPSFKDFLERVNFLLKCRNVLNSKSHGTRGKKLKNFY